MMSGAIYLILINFFVCVLTQYYGQYPYYNGGNIRIPVSNQGYPYRPCQSSCSSYCQYLPCYSQYSQYSRQPYYNIPYPYYNNYGGYSPYTNYYPTSRKTNPYSNVVVEIIDDDSVTQQKLPFVINNNNNNNKKQDEYANVPVEIIDVDDAKSFWKNIPYLPKSTRSSQSNYTVSQGAMTSSSSTQSKPISATITRSFQPLQQNPTVKIDFLNGKIVNDTEKNEDEEKKVTVTEAEETTTVVTTTEAAEEEEDESVPEVNNWLG